MFWIVGLESDLEFAPHTVRSEDGADRQPHACRRRARLWTSRIGEPHWPPATFNRLRVTPRTRSRGLVAEVGFGFRLDRDSSDDTLRLWRWWLGLGATLAG